MESDDITAIFRRSWSLYDFITERNYMFHREIYAEVARLLESRARLGVYHLLDLGCGNARFLAPCLEAIPPATYMGVDLSEAALNEARTHLADLPAAVTLHGGDLLHAVETHEDTWQVIFSGFAIHHLSQEEKARFFQAAAQRLTEDGWLILVDIVREEQDSRETYLESYLNFMREHWTGLPTEGFEEARAHIVAFDHPETFSTLSAMAAAAGLHCVVPVSRHGHHHTLLFCRNEAPKPALAEAS